MKINSLSLNDRKPIKPGRWYQNTKTSKPCLVIMVWLDGKVEVWDPPDYISVDSFPKMF